MVLVRLRRAVADRGDLPGHGREPEGTLPAPRGGRGGHGGSSYVDALVLRERPRERRLERDRGGRDARGASLLLPELATRRGRARDLGRGDEGAGAVHGVRDPDRDAAPWGDCDGDGDTDATDQAILLGVWGTGTAKCDLDLSGSVGAADQAIQTGAFGATAGFGNLGRMRNRFGYAGYCADIAVNADWHVRHRVLLSHLGRWQPRDPIGYADSKSLFEYARSGAVLWTDFSGLLASIYFVPALNFVGDCGEFGCSNPVVVINGATPISRSWLVVRVERDIYAWCCESETTESDRDGFYEGWGARASVATLRVSICDTASSGR